MFKDIIKYANKENCSKSIESPYRNYMFRKQKIVTACTE